jgi:hypothetical protein
MDVDPIAFFKKYKYVSSIIFLGFLVYANGLFGSPVWDDMQYIFQNPQLHSLNLFLLWGQNVFNNYIYYRPIPATYFALLSVLFGQQTFPFHFVQLSIHIINTLLLFVFFTYFFKRSLAFCLSLIFLVHPITVESVAYIAAADNTLLFTLGILLLLQIHQVKRSIKQYVCIFLLFLFLLLIKESGIMFILFANIYTFLYQRKNIFQILLTAGSSICLYFLIRFFVIGAKIVSPSILPIAAMPLSQRVFSMPKIFYYYFSTFFFPKNLAIEQYWVVTRKTFVDFYFPLGVDFLFFLIIGFIGYLIFIRRQKILQKTYIFFVLWFFIGIGLHLQIFPLDMTVADRWFYSPMIGLIGILGVGASIAFSCLKNKKNIVPVFTFIFVLILFGLSVRTLIRNTNWYDAFTLYQHDAQLTNSWSLENNLATEFFYRRDMRNALVHAKKAYTLLPMDNVAFNVGSIYEQKGDFTNAKKYYTLTMQAISDPTYGHKHYESIDVDIAEFYTLRDDPHKLYVMIAQALKDYPDCPDLWLYLAIADYRTGKYSDSLKAIHKANQLTTSSFVADISSKIEAKQSFTVFGPYDKKEHTITFFDTP